LLLVICFFAKFLKFLSFPKMWSINESEFLDSTKMFRLKIYDFYSPQKCLA
jgi:hypothetical protein